MLSGTPCDQGVEDGTVVPGEADLPAEPSGKQILAVRKWLLLKDSCISKKISSEDYSRQLFVLTLAS